MFPIGQLVNQSREAGAGTTGLEAHNPLARVLNISLKPGQSASNLSKQVASLVLSVFDKLDPDKN